MPLVTLLNGAAVGVAVLIASMLSAPAAPLIRNQAATAPASTPTVSVTLTPTSSATVVTLPPASSATVVTLPPSAPASSPYAGWPADADYAGEADHGGAWVTISVRGRQAIAYVRTGYDQARLNGTAAAGVLYLTGQNDARLAADYDAARAVGYVIADGVRYTFSAPAVHGTSVSSESAA